MSQREFRPNQEAKFKANARDEALSGSLNEKNERSEDWSAEQDKTLSHEEFESLQHTREARGVDDSEDAFAKSLDKSSKHKKKKEKGLGASFSASVIGDSKETIPLKVEDELTPEAKWRFDAIDYIFKSKVHEDLTEEQKNLIEHGSTDDELDEILNQTVSLEESIKAQTDTLNESTEFAATSEPAPVVYDVPAEMKIQRTIVHSRAFPAPEKVEQDIVVDAEQKQDQEKSLDKGEPEVQVNRPHIKYATIKDLKDSMKSLASRESDPAEWKNLGELEAKMESKYGITFTRAFVYTPEEHIEALTKLEAALELLPSDSFKGKRFKVGKNSDFHDKETIMIDHSAPQEELEIDLMQILSVIPESDEEIEVTKDATGDFKEIEDPKNDHAGEAVIDPSKIKPVTAIPTTPLSAPADNSPAENDPKLSDTSIPAVESEPITSATSDAEAEPTVNSTEKELADKLSNARESFIKARRALDDLKALNTLRLKIRMAVNDQTREQIDETIEKARLEYEQARLEYVGIDIERHQKEKLALQQSHLENYGRMEAGMAGKIERAWSRLADMNLNSFYDKKGTPIEYQSGRFIAKNVSVKNAIYGGLLLSGLVGSAVAIGAAGRYMSSIRNAGEYNRFVGKDTKTESLDWINKIESLDGIQREQAKIIMRASFGGKLEELQTRADYAALAAREKLIIERMPEAQRAKLLQEEGSVTAQYIDNSVGTENLNKNKARLRGLGKAGLFGLGVHTGVGALKNAFDVDADLERPSELKVPREIPDSKIPDLNTPDTITEPSIPEVTLPETPAMPEDTVVVEPEFQTTPEPELENDSEEIDDEEIIDTLEVGEKPVEPSDDGIVDKLEVGENPSNIGPEEIEVEKLDFNELKPDQPSTIAGIAEQAAEQAEEMRLESAIESIEDEEKISEGLEKLMGKDKFKDFKSDVYDFDARRINNDQHTNVNTFTEFYEKTDNPAHKRGYMKLHKNLKALLERSSPEEKAEISKGSVRNALIRMAVERLKHDA